MAIEDGLKISELNQATSVNDTDKMPLVQNGETKYIEVEDLLDGVMAKIDTNSNYSSTEKTIGTFNGKPLYRKIAYFTGAQMVVNAWTDAYAISNVETLVKGLFGADDNNTYAVWNDVPISYSNGQIRYYSTLAHYTNFLILEYTKTTD